MSSKAVQAPQTGAQANPRARSRLTLWLVFLTCAVPVALAFYFYYLDPPGKRNNYGELIEPQRDVPAAVSLKKLDGKPFSLGELKGKWILVQVAPSDCPEACQQLMYYQRQIRTSTGKERDRLERVVLLSDDGPLETMLLRQFDGVHFLRAKGVELDSWLPLPGGEMAPAARQGHVYVVDPLGHVMMRFPQPVDPVKMRKDISKLLWASKIG